MSIRCPLNRVNLTSAPGVGVLAPLTWSTGATGKAFRVASEVNAIPPAAFLALLNALSKNTQRHE